VTRPQLAALLGFVRDNDTVIVHSMDRLARNLDDLRRVVRELTARGVRVQFVKEQLTFTGDDTAMANLLLSVMGAFAEFERALIGERQREGIALAKQRGAYPGRRRSLNHEQAQTLRRRAADGVAQGDPGPRVRHQPRDRLPVQARRTRQPSPCGRQPMIEHDCRRNGTRP